MRAQKIPSIIYEDPDEEDKQSTIPISKPKRRNIILHKMLKHNTQRSRTTQLKMSKDYKYLSIYNDFYQDNACRMQTERKITPKHCKFLFSNAKLNEKTECLNQLDHNNELNAKEGTMDVNNDNTNTNQHHSCLNLQEMQLESKDLQRNTKDKVIEYREVLTYFFSLEREGERKIIIVKDFFQMNCSKHLLTKCFRKYKLAPSLIEERERIFFIDTINYDDNNPVHHGLLLSIYTFLLQPVNENKCNWELIGFQRNHQGESGMFGAIQIMSFIDKYPSFVINFFNYLKSIQSEKTFLVLLLNITSICLELLRNGVLIVYCNQSKKVFEALNKFYYGIVYQIYNDFIIQNEPSSVKKSNITIESINQRVTQAKQNAELNPRQFFWSQIKMDEEYPLSTKAPFLINQKANDNPIPNK